MPLPLDVLRGVDPALTGEFADPETLPRSQLLSRERGGVGVSDPSQGLNVQNWNAYQNTATGDIIVAPESFGTAQTIVNVPTPVTELSHSFDQNMRPQVAYVTNGQAYLYWYDTVIEGFTTTTLDPDVRSPVLLHDDVRDLPVQAGQSDVLLFYIRGPSLYYRQQRERYTVERKLATFAGNDIRITRAGFGSKLRVQVEVCGQQAFLVSVP